VVTACRELMNTSRKRAKDGVLNACVRSESRRRPYLNGAVFSRGKSEWFPMLIDEITNRFVNGLPTLKQTPGY